MGSQFSNLALRGVPKDEHFYQGSFYSAKTGITGLEFNYLDKQAMLFGERVVDITFRVEPDPGVLHELVAKLKVLYGFLNAKMLPPRAGVGCWKCKIGKSGRPYCRYSELCAEDSDPWELLDSQKCVEVLNLV